MLQNVQMALDFLRFKKIKLVNIRAEDIVDRKYPIQFETSRPPQLTLFHHQASEFGSVFNVAFPLQVIQSSRWASSGPSSYISRWVDVLFANWLPWHCKCSRKLRFSNVRSLFLPRNVLETVEAAGKFFLSPTLTQFRSTPTLAPGMVTHGAINGCELLFSSCFAVQIEDEER